MIFIKTKNTREEDFIEININHIIAIWDDVDKCVSIHTSDGANWTSEESINEFKNRISKLEHDALFQDKMNAIIK